MFIQYKLYSEGKEVKTFFTRTKDGINMLLAYCGKCYEEEFETLTKIINKV